MGTLSLSLLYLLLLFSPSLSFVLLPYVQIDYAHYFRLAVCQAKCSQKYGQVMNRRLNDGSFMEVWDNSKEDMQQCTLGCEQPRKTKLRSLPSARLDGATFWQESHATTTKSTSSSPISRLSLLCQNISPSEGGLSESIEGLLSLQIAPHSGPLRLLVQWKHRVLEGGVVVDGGSTITAAIESDPLIKVEGLVPGTQYRFSVTAIGPGGKMGETIHSQWIEAIHNERSPEGSIRVREDHSIENGVQARVSWTRSHQDSCWYTVQLRNVTHEEKRNVVLDSTTSILFSNLEMDSEYEVSVSSTDLSSNPHPRPLLYPFKTRSCTSIHGRGSLNCPPDPVEDLRVSTTPNGTATVTWKPSADSSLVLTYEISAQPISPCETARSHVFVNAATSSAILSLGETRPCEYSIRVTNYDLVGRDASKETRVLLAQPSALFSAQLDGLIAGGLATIALLCLLLLVKCLLCCGRKREKKLPVGYV